MMKLVSWLVPTKESKWFELATVECKSGTYYSIRMRWDIEGKIGVQFNVSVVSGDSNLM